MALEGFSETSFTHDAETRPVFHAGSGPAVVVVHEIPGITPQVAAFGRRVVESGLTAVLPMLVLSQPSCPLPVTADRRAAIDVSPDELAVVKRRAAAGVGVLGLRFTHDRACPKERFDFLRHELGTGFEAIEIDSGPRNPHGIRRARIRW